MKKCYTISPPWTSSLTRIVFNTPAIFFVEFLILSMMYTQLDGDVTWRESLLLSRTKLSYLGEHSESKHTNHLSFIVSRMYLHFVTIQTVMNNKCLSYRPPWKSHCYIFNTQVPFTLVVDPGEGPRYPLIFRPHWGPKGRKNFFCHHPQFPPSPTPLIVRVLILTLLVEDLCL